MDYSKDIARVIVTEKEIQSAVKRICRQMERDFSDSDKKLLLMGILKGSVVFMSDIMKNFNLRAETDFIRVSSYGASTVSGGIIRLKSQPDLSDLSRYNVVVIEDILDSGNTLHWLLCHLKNELKADTVKVCTLFNKPERREKEIHVDYEGFVIPDEFIVGYGLDYNEEYRNLPYVGVLKPEIYKMD